MLYCFHDGWQQRRPVTTDMHPDTLAAVRLLALALLQHPEDLETFQIYGDMADHLNDLIDDYINDD